MMIFLFCVFVFLSQPFVTISHCPSIEVCNCDTDANEILCDGSGENMTSNDYFPTISSLPPMQTYVFQNFKHIQEHAFENVTFPSNQSISLVLINVTVIDSRAFSGDTLSIPDGSSLSINLLESKIALKHEAFHNLKLERLHFENMEFFNGDKIFNADCFGDHVEINELIFEGTGLTGFTGSNDVSTAVKTIRILQSSSFDSLTANNAPTFLSQTEVLEISGTSLNSIDSGVFTTDNLKFKELSIHNNSNLRSFPSAIFSYPLTTLRTLDLGFNCIEQLDSDFNWDDYNYTNVLLLQQQKIDLFLRSNILKNLKELKSINFSYGFIDDRPENENLINEFVPQVSSLVSVDLSYTNLTETLIIDWLTLLSDSANQTIKIHLLGHTLNESRFCSYFTIFQNAENLIQLQLDETHPCNCIVDLFFQYGNFDDHEDFVQPSCLKDINRPVCNISDQLISSKCSIRRPSTDDPNGNVPSLSQYAIIGIAVVLSAVLLLVLGIASGRVYRRRTLMPRRETLVDMEDPIERSIEVLIDESVESTS